MHQITGHPWKGLAGRKGLTGQILCPVSIDFLCILWLPLCFFLLYRRNILSTKILCFCKQFSYSRIFEISSNYLYLWGIPWLSIRSFRAVSIATDVHGPDISLLQLCPLLSIGIMSSVFLLHLLAFHCRILSSYTSVQTPHGIYNSISYVLNYSCHYLARAA